MLAFRVLALPLLLAGFDVGNPDDGYLTEKSDYLNCLADGVLATRGRLPAADSVAQATSGCRPQWEHLVGAMEAARPERTWRFHIENLAYLGRCWAVEIQKKGVDALRPVDGPRSLHERKF